MSVSRLVVLAIAAVSLTVAGCSSDESSSGDEGSQSESFDFGQPADPSDADQTIKITANDDFSFDPDAVEVEVGEVVTFSVTNSVDLPHEFTRGPGDVQQEHEEEMAEMGDMEMDNDPNAISVPAGETVDLTWEFTEAGSVLYGCHTQGHYDAGMVGNIDVAEPS